MPWPCLLLGEHPPIRIVRAAADYRSPDGRRALPLPAHIAGHACQQWFPSLLQDITRRRALCDAVRMVNGWEAIDLSQQPSHVLVAVLEQALRSGRLVAYKGSVQQVRPTYGSNSQAVGSFRAAAAPIAAPEPAKPEPEPEEILYTCRWKNCQGNHKADINHTYPSDGVTKHGKDSHQVDYSDAWVAAGLEPWDEAQGPGTDPQASREDYQQDLLGDKNPKPKNLVMITQAVTAGPKQYVTQKHHLISIHLFPQFAMLNSNAKLIGYNANDASNGICLPYFTLDIVRHDRQCHRGNHPAMYDDRIKLMLEKAQSSSLKLCQEGHQERLLGALHRIEDRIRKCITDWVPGYYLRSKAVEERIAAYSRINQNPPSV